MSASFPPNTALFQQDSEKVNSAIAHLEGKVASTKRIVEELLMMLDMQENAPWPDMLEKFASLAASMSQLQGTLRRSAIPSTAQEDHGALLRSHVMVPIHLQLELDPELQRLTENRIPSWNHDVVPDYLRTKLNPELESEEMNFDQERNTKQTGEAITRQIGTLNKHVDILVTALQSGDRGQSDATAHKPTYSREETARLVRAVVNGEGLKINRGGTISQASSSAQLAPSSAGAMPTAPGGGAAPQVRPPGAGGPGGMMK